MVFDFHNPWMAGAQIALMFVLPMLVGLVTDRLAASIWKVLLLGGLALATSLLNGWVDAATTGTEWDWVNALGNGLVTWGLSAAAYLGILKPSGIADAVQNNTAIQFIKANADRVADEAAVNQVIAAVTTAGTTATPAEGEYTGFDGDGNDIDPDVSDVEP